MDHSLLMCVLHRLANRDKELETLAGGEIALIAVVGDRDPLDELHDKIRPTVFCGTCIEDLGNAGMVHHRQGLSLGLEASDHLAGIHTWLDDLQRHSAS